MLYGIKQYFYGFNICRYIRFPRNKIDRKRWIQICKKRDPKHPFKYLEPKGHFLCSHHFVDKKPTQTNPDPTIFLGLGILAVKRQQAAQSRKDRARNRAKNRERGINS